MVLWVRQMQPGLTEKRQRVFEVGKHALERARNVARDSIPSQETISSNSTSQNSAGFQYNIDQHSRELLGGVGTS